MDEIEIRKIKFEEINDAIELVWRVFLEFEAPDYTKEGIEEFKNTIENDIWIKEREFFCAFKNNKIIGVIATKDKHHIALFFVDKEYQRQGIGRKLFSYILELNSDKFFTVNSSPYAHEVYKSLGFMDTNELQCINGLKFYPMKKEF